MTKEDQPKCALCGTTKLSEYADNFDPKDWFCHGCQSYICDGCEKNPNMPWGGHNPETHAEEDWD